MLPLDKFNEEVKAGFEKHGVKEENVLIALELDLNENGDFGNTWLAVDKEKMKLYAISITSDAETVGQALLDEELIAGEDSQYGLYVKTVNGLTLDYDKDGAYWAFYVNGEYATSGVDSTEIEDGQTYSFRAEKG